MDTLRKDYPELLRKKPDYSIYHENIQITDPSRVQNRMIYDFTRSSIRVTWNVVLVPKVVGNARNSLYVDGVSVYSLNAKGEIIEHRFEKLLINNNPVVPPYNVFLSLTQGLMTNPSTDGLVPVGIGA